MNCAARTGMAAPVEKPEGQASQGHVIPPCNLATVRNGAMGLLAELTGMNSL